MKQLILSSSTEALPPIPVSSSDGNLPLSKRRLVTSDPRHNLQLNQFSHKENLFVGRNLMEDGEFVAKAAENYTTHHDPAISEEEISASNQFNHNHQHLHQLHHQLKPTKIWDLPVNNIDNQTAFSLPSPLPPSHPITSPNPEPLPPLQARHEAEGRIIVHPAEAAAMKLASEEENESTRRIDQNRHHHTNNHQKKSASTAHRDSISGNGVVAAMIQRKPRIGWWDGKRDIEREKAHIKALLRLHAQPQVLEEEEAIDFAEDQENLIKDNRNDDGMNTNLEGGIILTKERQVHHQLSTPSQPAASLLTRPSVTAYEKRNSSSGVIQSMLEDDGGLPGYNSSSSKAEPKQSVAAIAANLQSPTIPYSPADISQEQQQLPKSNRHNIHKLTAARNSSLTREFNNTSAGSNVSDSSVSSIEIEIIEQSTSSPSVPLQARPPSTPSSTASSTGSASGSFPKPSIKSLSRTLNRRFAASIANSDGASASDDTDDNCSSTNSNGKPVAHKIIFTADGDEPASTAPSSSNSLRSCQDWITTNTHRQQQKSGNSSAELEVNPRFVNYKNLQEFLLNYRFKKALELVR